MLPGDNSNSHIYFVIFLAGQKFIPGPYRCPAICDQYAEKDPRIQGRIWAAWTDLRDASRIYRIDIQALRPGASRRIPNRTSLD